MRLSSPAPPRWSMAAPRSPAPEPAHQRETLRRLTWDCSLKVDGRTSGIRPSRPAAASCARTRRSATGSPSTAAPVRRGIGGFKAEAGRYHLYVSLACPWAHRTLIMRTLKGLEDKISVSVAHWLMLEHGWTFADGPGVVPDTVDHAEFLHEIYTAADPHYTGRVTVPVLWDKHRRTIVNNESSEIIRMLNSAFDEIGQSPATTTRKRCAPTSTRSMPGSTTRSTTASTKPASRPRRPPTRKAVVPAVRNARLA